MKTILFITLCILSFETLAQDTPIDSIVKDVNELNGLRLKNMFETERDFVFNQFDSAVTRMFEHPDICNYIPDTAYYYIEYNPSFEDLSMQYYMLNFANNIVICNSEDNRLRVYSWDDLGGGSAHSYHNYLQYEKGIGTCEIIEIDTAEFSLSVGYYDIKSINDNGQIYYFLFGYGTYGSGLHHMNMRIFTIIDDELIECISCYPEVKAIELFSNRSQELFIKLNEDTNELSLKKYVYDEDIDFYTKEFKIVKYKFKDKKLGPVK